MEGALYHKDQSSCVICGFSALSRGREHIVCLKPKILEKKTISDKFPPNCERVAFDYVVNSLPVVDGHICILNEKLVPRILECVLIFVYICVFMAVGRICGPGDKVESMGNF